MKTFVFTSNGQHNTFIDGDGRVHDYRSFYREGKFVETYTIDGETMEVPYNWKEALRRLETWPQATMYDREFVASILIALIKRCEDMEKFSKEGRHHGKDDSGT